MDLNLSDCEHISNSSPQYEQRKLPQLTKGLAPKTSLTPTPFIEVSASSQKRGRPCTCVLGISIFSLSDFWWMDGHCLYLFNSFDALCLIKEFLFFYINTRYVTWLHFDIGFQEQENKISFSNVRIFEIWKKGTPCVFVPNLIVIYGLNRFCSVFKNALKSIVTVQILRFRAGIRGFRGSVGMWATHYLQ